MANEQSADMRQRLPMSASLAVYLAVMTRVATGPSALGEWAWIRNGCSPSARLEIEREPQASIDLTHLESIQYAQPAAEVALVQGHDLTHVHH